MQKNKTAVTPPEQTKKTTQTQDERIQLVEAEQYKSAIERLIAFFKVLIKRKKDTEILIFRRYKKLEGGKKKARHPKLIIEVTDDEYIFMGLTESEKKGRHKNIELIPNPKAGDTRRAFVRKELRVDSQKQFSEILSQYELSEDSLNKIANYLENKNKK